MERDPAEFDTIIDIISEALASKTFGYGVAGNGTKARRALRPVAREAVLRLHERGFVIAAALSQAQEER